MTPDDSYETPFQTDEEAQQPDESETSGEAELTHPGDSAEADAAQQAWDSNDAAGGGSYAYPACNGDAIHPFTCYQPPATATPPAPYTV